MVWRLQHAFVLLPIKQVSGGSEEAPFRSELFGVDQLQRHGRELARRHHAVARQGPNRLLSRLAANEKVLRSYNEQTLRVDPARRITPAAEWLLDNYHLIEGQIRTARRHLPKRFSYELPHLASGPSSSFPRVYDLAKELVSHTDGRVDAPHLTGFVAAYQEVTELKLGELWAIPIMLRLALIENLRRVAVLLGAARRDRDLADTWAERLMEVAESGPSELIIAVGDMAQAGLTLSRAFVAEFWRRAQEKSPAFKLALSWIEVRLAGEGQTIEHLIQGENQDQASHQVSVGNSIASLRFLDAMDWREFVETLSLVEQILRRDPAKVYGAMDFATRDRYRHTIERVARHSGKSEPAVAQLAVDLAHPHAVDGDLRRGHIGYYLADRGVNMLERAAEMRVPARAYLPRFARRFPLAFYLGGVGVVTFLVSYPLIVRIVETAAPGWLLGLLIVLIATGASQLGVALVNWLATLLVSPHTLPRLDFSEGIPAEYATMVVVPTLLTGAGGIENLLEALEVRYLANRDRNVFFALLTDFRDAPCEHLPGDAALVRQVREGIHALNDKYRHDRRSIFYLFHRPRRWNASENVWMGYERKRGKLSDLNHCLRGGRRDCFSEVAGDLAALPRIKYVITLDTDTQLPRDAARQLAGAMAHPLNQPVFDSKRGLIVAGYSILQPRVAVSLPSANRSRFVQLFSGDAGVDPYTRSVSDVYQDVFQEGSFVGKGIYEVDAFERAAGGRFPENRILSHDLLEGCHARSGLVSDVQLFEEFPSRHNSDTRRRHRWVRGDWQIATWLLPRVPGPDARRLANPLTGLSRWKILDNLRRSLVPIALTGLLTLGWTFLSPDGVFWSLFVVTIVFLPATLGLLADVLRKSGELPLGMHLRNVIRSAWRQLGQGLLTLAFLPYDAGQSLDAVGRTLIRLCCTGRHLLEWQTASETDRQSRTSLPSFLLTMWSGPAIAIVQGLVLWLLQATAWRAALPFLIVWCVSPAIAWWISLPLTEAAPDLSADQKRFLRGLCRKTWRYFETFVGPKDHWLPPDNFQEHPHPVVATRTSPTNLGLSLLSTLAAHDFGYISLGQLIGRVTQTFESMGKLERYRGHFYNWYDTRTLQPLPPLYISTVDSGNLAGLLMTLRSGLIELSTMPLPTVALFSGLRDTLNILLELARSEGSLPTKLVSKLEALGQELDSPSSHLPDGVLLIDSLLELLTELSASTSLESEPEFTWWRQALERECLDQRNDLETLFPWLKLREQFSADSALSGTIRARLQTFWQDLSRPRSLQELARHTEARRAQAEEILADSSAGKEMAGLLPAVVQSLHQGAVEASRRLASLRSLVKRCDEFVQMDFTLLYEPSRELFSIGYNLSQHRLDASCYDLLASEARLASFVAISLGQVPQRHWFALGRLLTTSGGQPTLISWSGSMFEYLMPLLIMPTYDHTLLDASCKTAVARQIEYGNQLGVPWGISESGYALTDAQANYQYRAFGVPGLGFQRGLAEDTVVAPYATTMALTVAPREACRNLQRLRQERVEGIYGLYEAIDYTPSRLPPGETSVTVQSFMAHHQGMSMLALAYQLLDRPMQRRFQANPSFQAAELLLHERLPRETAMIFPHEAEAARSRPTAPAAESHLRVFSDPNAATPDVHLLSNGRYHVMITSAGGGYSVWKDVALTRWRDDATRDCWGAFVYLRDMESGQFWSTAYQPTRQAGSGYEAIFSQGRAEFRLGLHEIETHLEVSVSPEDDLEVRRVTLTNRSGETRWIEVTSYAEVALNSAAADLAHPAFSKLFVQTEVLRAQHSILCSRRPRAKGEQPPWLFHLMLAPEGEAGEASYETDRARFLGRGRTAASPAALDVRSALSNSEGSVLDPIISIRRRIRLSPHELVRVTLVTGIASSRAAAAGLVGKYQDQSIADRVFDLAWTHGLVTLHHLNATEYEAQLYGRLAGALLYSQAVHRAPAAILSQNLRGQRNLWSFGISGDLPVVLLRCASPERMDLVRQVLQAHGFWRSKGLSVDLVILNDDTSVYRQAVHDQIMTLITTGREAQWLDKPGGIFVRRADQLSREDQTLLLTVARIVLSDEGGTFAEQTRRRARREPLVPSFTPIPARIRPAAHPPPEEPEADLVFFNGLGGFTRDGREYVIKLAPDQVTPAPWVNVLGNPEFGTLISESGSSYSWGENCHEFRLTPWHNDPVSDPSGEAFYLRDENTGRFWSPTPRPAPGRTPYVIRHGFGSSVFEHAEEGIVSELCLYIAVNAPVKFARLKLRNVSGRARQISVTGYWEWVLGESREKNLPYIVTELDPRSGAVLARNSYNGDFEKWVAFVTISESTCTFTGDRAEFIGRNRSLASPAALGRQRLSGKLGSGLDPCAALQSVIRLAPDEEREIFFKLGVASDLDKARHLIQVFRSPESCQEALRAVGANWSDTLGAVQVETPDPALNLLANGWLVYQTLSCRLWARTGFYQSGGAFGFRDQLQDGLALMHSRPGLLREHLLRAAAHQFREGDVQHWWHPPTSRGVRTHFSDDYLWLPFVTCRYVAAIGDTGILDEKISFLEGRAVRVEEEGYFDTPQRSTESGTLYDHCVRAIRYGLRFGAHGLPLMGSGDWNDGMNLVGEKGQGESVWLAFFLYDGLRRFANLARGRGDKTFAVHCEEQAAQLRENIEKNGWDGEWYRRAYFDNGDPLGSAENPECQIDSLPQSWAVLSGAADPVRAGTAMEAVAQRLVRWEAGLIQLFDPPFDTSVLEPGYIKGYVPGVRENGGQYTHAALWTVMAFAQIGQAQRAWELFNLINPIRRALTPTDLNRYQVEPYVVAADVYSLKPHTGRGGWTWYTGSAGWMYQLIIETFLGLTLDVDKLRFAPRLPGDWKSFKIRYRYRETTYHISIANVSGAWRTSQKVVVDGKEEPGGVIPLIGDRKDHHVEVQC